MADGIKYDGANKSITLTTSGSTVLTVDKNNTNLSGNLYVSGTLYLNNQQVSAGGATIPTASATENGIVTTGSQTLAGNKILSGTLDINHYNYDLSSTGTFALRSGNGWDGRCAFGFYKPSGSYSAGIDIYNYDSMENGIEADYGVYAPAGGTWVGSSKNGGVWNHGSWLWLDVSGFYELQSANPTAHTAAIDTNDVPADIYLGTGQTAAKKVTIGSAGSGSKTELVAGKIRMGIAEYGQWNGGSTGGDIYMYNDNTASTITIENRGANGYTFIARANVNEYIEFGTATTATKTVNIGSQGSGSSFNVNAGTTRINMDDSPLQSGITMQSLDHPFALQIASPTAAFIDLGNPNSDDFDLRIMTNNTIGGGGYIVNSGTAKISLSGSSVGINTFAPSSAAALDVNGALKVNGPITASVGGIKFPDGTIQTTAGGGGGSSVYAYVNPGGTTTINLSLSNNFKVLLDYNSTIISSSNPTEGQSGIITFVQPDNNAYGVTFTSFWRFPSGSSNQLTLSGSAIDVLSYYIHSGSSGYYALCSIVNNFV